MLHPKLWLTFVSFAGTFRQMSDAVDSGIPIVLVQGSGGAADFMVDLWKQLHGRLVLNSANLSHKKIDQIWIDVPRDLNLGSKALGFGGSVRPR